ncbi:hypothetical protein TDB9533_03450 [Thalassocella blandensis]|nr:hypothetical protein TDB9533_03450 [Thalassocella blandensis]
MQKLVALHAQEHKHFKIKTEAVESVGSHERMIPVVMSEFIKLSVQYPIVFTKNIETGQFVLVALMGFEERENLFWKNDEWDAIYVPLNVTRQPFFIGADAQTKQHLICIDIASPCISMEEGESIYQQDGSESEYMNTIRNRLSELFRGEQEAAGFIDILGKLDLLVPLSLDISFANESHHQVQGVYTIDEEKLQALDKATIGELHAAQYLRPIYTMINSLSHIYGLIQRKNQRLENA